MANFELSKDEVISKLQADSRANRQKDLNQRNFGTRRPLTSMEQAIKEAQFELKKRASNEY